MFENAFLVVSKLNCSLGIERLDTCIDLNEPEVDCMNWRIQSVKKKKKENKKSTYCFWCQGCSLNCEEIKFGSTWSKHEATTDSALSLGPSTGD